MILPDPFVLSICLVDTGGVLFLLVYFVITLSDLECDYLNAQQCCSKLNFWTIPKIVAQLFIEVLLLLHGHWGLFLMNIPITGWFVWEYMKVPTGNTGVYDPTEIHNRGQLKRHMWHCMIYLCYFLVAFFIYLYCLIISLLKSSPFKRPDEDTLSEM
ncbi:protein cornichon homolog 4 [Schistocerca cancellata]|uniref:protein cornichon homolog 4 n=1 Tax=Schistocerca cancellata TaxID=274614 RepID=UPI0021178B37|nr:protein cornichon homolog 4 [Schistocerca cancellata]